jgi:hypothetical protein
MGERGKERHFETHSVFWSAALVNLYSRRPEIRAREGIIVLV